MTARAQRVVIVGGGISGMATALAVEREARRRSRPCPELLVLEADDRVGGKIRTIRAEGFSCEWGVNGFLNKEPKTLELCQQLGLEERLLPASGAFKNRFIFTRGRLRPVQLHPLKFLFSGLLPLAAKLRLIREPWIKPRAGDDDESVADFARRRVGDVAFRVLVDPMQTGIFAGDPERMSVASCFPRVVEVERQYGSLVKGLAQLSKERRRQQLPTPSAGPAGHLTSFNGGMQTLVDRLAEVLGDRVRTGSRVRGLERTARGFTVALEGAPLEGAPLEGAPLEADAVVLACPAFEAAAITRDLDAALSATLDEIPYSPLVVVCLGYPRAQVPHPLDGFGFLAPRDAGLRILGALWTSTLFPERVPDSQVLLRVMVGGARDPDVLELDDRQLQELVCAEVDRVHGGAGAPSFVRIFRHRCAIPQYLVGHGERLGRIEERASSIPGLVVTGNALRGVGVNDCVVNAIPAAERVLAALT
jgi:oxygen-dependent protoporphyrinogen oxidase